MSRGGAIRAQIYGIFDNIEDDRVEPRFETHTTTSDHWKAFHMVERARRGTVGEWRVVNNIRKWERPLAGDKQVAKLERWMDIDLSPILLSLHCSAFHQSPAFIPGLKKLEVEFEYVTQENGDVLTEMHQSKELKREESIMHFASRLVEVNSKLNGTRKIMWHDERLRACWLVYQMSIPLRRR